MFISGLSDLPIAFLFGMVCRVQGLWPDSYYDELPADMKAYADWAYTAYAGASTSAFAPSRFFPASMIGCTLIYIYIARALNFVIQCFRGRPLNVGQNLAVPSHGTLRTDLGL
jgi:hypothetical protein